MDTNHRTDTTERSPRMKRLLDRRPSFLIRMGIPLLILAFTVLAVVVWILAFR